LAVDNDVAVPTTRLATPRREPVSVLLAELDPTVNKVRMQSSYKVLTTSQPSYLHNLISLQPPSQYPLLICRYLFSPTTHLLIENR